VDRNLCLSTTALNITIHLCSSSTVR
jgi:hypothetical protein